MHILLREGDVIRGADDFLDPTGRRWLPVPEEWSYKYREVRQAGQPAGGVHTYRRKLTGWEAVKHALETEVLGNDKEGRETTSWAWGCGKCETGAVRQDRDWQCPECGAFNTEDIPARKVEVILKIMEE